jgi:hypothetical protein
MLHIEITLLCDATILHNMTFQKAAVFIVNAVRVSGLTVLNNEQCFICTLF